MQKIIERIFVMLIALLMLSVLIVPLYKRSFNTIEKYEVILPAKKNCILINNTIIIAFINKTTVISLLNFVEGFKIRQEGNELIISVIANNEAIFQTRLSYNFDIDFINKTVIIKENVENTSEFIEFIAIPKTKGNYKTIVRLLITLK